MNRLMLFRQLRRNNKLGYRRNPAFEQSKVAKALMWVGAGFMAIYLIFFGVMFSMVANEQDEPGAIMAIMPLLLLIDFGARFAVQQTPAVLVKPYLLLPLPKQTVVETFLLTSVLSSYNWLWLCLFIPYGIIIWAGCASFGTMLLVVLSGLLLIMLNSQWYLMIRTLIGRSLLWWLLPIALNLVYFLPLMLGTKSADAAFDAMSDGLAFAGAQWWFPLLCLLLLCGLFLANRRMQSAFIYEEIAKEEKTEGAMKNVSQFLFFERFGETGEYLKLELKSILRNKAMRSRCIMSLGLIVVLSLIVSYTTIYDGRMMTNFWCFYCFALYGITSLVKIMGPEGNYMDLLMTHRENILTLLRAKYYFHCAITVVPFLIMLPAVIEGKFTWLMMLAYMMLCCGFMYFVMFLLAIYNKQTLPLNQKITGKGNVENGQQLILELVALLGPLALVALLLLFLDATTTYIVLLVIGLAFVATHPLWLRYVYNRMMARKYENLEGFHATR